MINFSKLYFLQFLQGGMHCKTEEESGRRGYKVERGGIRYREEEVVLGGVGEEKM